ncbi:peroxiredoxin-like family protein [Salinispirillum marinum]|uniref:Peroxiredoxin-like family protein n=2 Tax=Saccharospirillaceae TaxID=255527 RepID=A0ABV8BIP0_9GAMM
MSLIPRQPVPALQVPLFGHESFDLAHETAENFTLLVFYRGHHCPICMSYLRSLNELHDEFTARGVSVLALSSDSAERAQATHDKLKLGALRLGYGLTADAARQWGLFRSAGKGKTSIGIEEPAEFSEPGLFLVRPDGTLYFSTVQTMPFSRPDFPALLKTIDFVLEKDYPARGELQ